MAANASFVSPTADAKVAHMMAQVDASGLLSTAFNGLSLWKLVLTLFFMAVAYDQCMHRSNRVRRTLLTALQSSTSGTRAPSRGLR